MFFKRAKTVTKLNNWRKVLYIIFLVIWDLLLPIQLFSQSPTEEYILEQAISDEESVSEDAYEYLLQYKNQPLDLNEVTRKDLSSLFLLSELQMNEFFKYRLSFGPFLSVNELQVIPTFDIDIVNKLLPYVAVYEGFNIKSFYQDVLNAKNKYMLVKQSRSLEKKAGYKEGEGKEKVYNGSPDKITFKGKISVSGKTSLGFTAEKDEGEKFVWDPVTKRYGQDFYSFHFQVKNIGVLKNLVIGDYKISHGQGLLLGGFSLGKGSESVLTLRRNSLGVKPYTSSAESGFFRGIAGTVGKNRLQLTGFYSFIKEDGNLETDTLTMEEEGILRRTGYHRTKNEIEGKSLINQNSFGSILEYSTKNENFFMGAIYLNSIYSTRIVPREALYSRFNFTGSHNYNTSAYFNYSWENISFFGEGGVSKSGGKGMVGGLVASLHRSLDIALLIRKYDPDFHSFFGTSFREGTSISNEQGFYYGIKVTPASKYIFTAYFDSFKFPWLKFNADAPSQGSEYLLQGTWTPSKSVNAYLRYKCEKKEKNITESKVNVLKEARKEFYVLNLDVGKNNWSTRSRIQYSSYRFNNKTSEGFLILQDVGFQYHKFKINGRYALFDVDDFENKQYVFENDVLYAFSYPFYYNKGCKYIIVASYKINKHWQVWIRWARTHYEDLNSISSGTEEISGNVKTDISSQIMFRF